MTTLPVTPDVFFPELGFSNFFSLAPFFSVNPSSRVVFALASFTPNSSSRFEGASREPAASLWLELCRMRPQGERLCIAQVLMGMNWTQTLTQTIMRGVIRDKLRAKQREGASRRKRRGGWHPKPRQFELYHGVV